MKNETVYMKEAGTMFIREIEVPEPKDDEVLVEIKYCGICGSDVHYYENGRIGDYIVEGDFTLGHEVAGEIVKLGSNVKDLKVGDRVALEPGIPCGKCECCKEGKYNLCPDVVFFATPPVQGALQNYVVHPADMCFKLPDHVGMEEGALVEPLCVGLHACRQGDVKLGDNVVILGAGCIGLATLLSAKAMGASNVVVVDLFEKRLEFAKEMGANYVINAGREDVFDECRKIFGGRGADIVIETAGSPKTIYQTPMLAKQGGTVVLVGIAVNNDLTYNFGQVMSKELTIKSVFRYRNLYPVAIAAIADGSIDVKKMITHRFPLHEAKKAFDTVIADAENVVKAVIEL
ncbi:NAD(P)-dependent alcohol dehydrogenase [Blautia schinkii]|nr:NAD(P)-dependent alcohol dehydrogenase [Blautia schinkii]